MSRDSNGYAAVMPSKNRAAVPEALKGYRRLAQQALKLLPPDGILVFCCCTGLIAMAELEEILQQAAQNAKQDRPDRRNHLSLPNAMCTALFQT